MPEFSARSWVCHSVNKMSSRCTFCDVLRWTNASTDSTNDSFPAIRYIHRKYPHRTATKRKKKTKKQRHSTLHATPDAPKAVKSPEPSPTRKPGEPSRTSNVPMPSASVPRCGQIEPGGGAFEHDDTEPSSSRRDENKQTSLKLKPEKSCLPDPSPNNLSVKISGKKKRRPRATHGRRDSASSPTSESEGTEKCEAPGNSFETSASDPRASRESDHG